MPIKPPILGQKLRARKPDDRRSASARGYGRNWQKLRLSVLAEEPLCRACLARGQVVAAVDVDHIVPKSKGGTDHRSNLQPLCHPCHSVKTGTEDRQTTSYSAPRGTNHNLSR